MKTSRRNILLGVTGAAVAGGVALTLPPVRRGICGSPEEQYRTASLARLGEACVVCQRLARTDIERRWATLAPMQAAEIRAIIAADFGAGRVASIDGWHFSNTEITIFAAAHFDLPSLAA